MRVLLRHITTYRYANPVTLERHRLMLRPCDSHEMKLHDAVLTLRPVPAEIVWQYDVFGNAVTLVSFVQPTSELSIDSTLDVERFSFAHTAHLVSSHAQTLPLADAADEVRDLAGLQERHMPAPGHMVDQWAKSILVARDGAGSLPRTLQVLDAMTAAIKSGFEYFARDSYGTRNPQTTLESRSGTCRDFAYLMMEGARSLGLAARFVSGYIYDASRDTRSEGCEAAVGGGATHAWVQVYLPGAGWAHFDPTNALRAGGELIPVAIVRAPARASPISGRWSGAAGDYLGLKVDVSVVSRQAAES